MSIQGTALVYAIHRTDNWWSYVAENLGYAKGVVVTDIRNTGDHCVVDDFYVEYARLSKQGKQQTTLLSDLDIEDIIARCRLLRWLPRDQAVNMVCAMAYAFDIVLQKVQPEVVLCFPIDRYVSDVLARLANARGIPCFELTASLVSGMSMLLYRGQLIKSAADPLPTLIENTVAEIATPTFTPSYVQKKSTYTALRFLKVFSYFKVRGLAFWAISHLKRDPMNLHYMDSQSFLGHKPRLRDMRILRLINHDWRKSLDSFPKEKRIFFGLQLFPEASIDYWISKIDLIDYENIVVAAAKAFSDANFLILVKDHPLQFGFRQCELIDRLLQIPNVVLVPYDVSGNEVMDLSDSNFTLTGTLGLQAALLGKKSITTTNYYTTDEDFINFSSKEEIAELPSRVTNYVPPDSLEQRRYRIMRHLLKGSFNGEFFTFKGFDAAHPNPQTKDMATKLGNQLRVLTRA